MEVNSSYEADFPAGAKPTSAVATTFLAPRQTPACSYCVEIQHGIDEKR
jgi:hypothetical protein